MKKKGGEEDKSDNKEQQKGQRWLMLQPGVSGKGKDIVYYG